MESSSGSAAVGTTATTKSLAVILWKAVEHLERQREACAKDSRPKTVQGLKNNVAPLCKVIFFNDIAKILRNVHKKSHGRNMLMRRTVRSEMSSVSFSVTELLGKISKCVSAKARKQRRGILSAQVYTEPFKSIQSQMRKWKELYKSQAHSYGDVLSALVNACIFTVDLENADSLISLLKKSGVVDVDDAGNVNYAFPNHDALEAAVSKFKSRYSSAWNKKKDDWKYEYPNQHLLNDSNSEMGSEVDDGLDELTVRIIVHLQKMKNHMPKTEKGLKNALEPLLSWMYVVSPKPLLESLIDKSQTVSVRNTRKRSFRAHNQRSGQHSDMRKVVFKHRGKNDVVEPVCLNHMIHEIGSVLLQKRVHSLSPHKNFMSRASGGNEAQKVKSNDPKPVFYVLQKLLQEGQKKAQHLNRSVIFFRPRDDVACEERVTKWLQANTEPPIDQADVGKPFRPEEDSAETPVEEDGMSTDAGNVSEDSAKVDNSHTSGSKQAVNIGRSYPMSAVEMLTSLQGMLFHSGDIDPLCVVNVLMETGYCSVHRNCVTYSDTFPTKTYLGSLKEMITCVTQELYTSFLEGSISKETKIHLANTQVKKKESKSPVTKHGKGLRKRPRYQ